jgi:hypothetical protein
MTQQRNSKGKKNEKATVALERRPYIKPQLIKYGDLEKLTEGTTGRRWDFRLRRRVP